MLSILLILLTFFIDRYFKKYIKENLDRKSTYKLNKNIDFLYTENHGMAFNLFDKYNIMNLLIIISIILLIALIYFLIKNYIILNIIEKISYAIIIGGGIGNLFDRIFNGFVIDFIKIKTKKYSLPIMNFADIFIFSGCVFLIIYSFFI